MIGYSLREAFTGTVVQREHKKDPGTEVPYFTGGLIRIDDDRDLNLADALAEGNGIIAVEENDAPALLALDEHPALKRVAIEDGQEAELDNAYEAEKVGELRGNAEARGLEGAKSANKPDLVLALGEHDLRLRDGSLDELGSPLTIDRLAAAAAERASAGDAGQEA